MRKLMVNARDFVTREAMHEAMRKALEEENYWGSNLDALHDCLTSIFEPTELRVINWSYAATQLRGYSDGLWRVLSDSSDENSNLAIIIE